METKTYNKNNWSGENVSVKIGKNTVRFNGLILRWKEVKFSKGLDGTYHKVFWKYSDSNDYSDFIDIFKDEEGTYHSESMGVERESKDLVEVIVQMACNLI